MDAKTFVERNLNHSGHVDRPSVTLTFAQSLDAKIAGNDGVQLILSGKESMLMTHWLRARHDAIMVGVGTALNDNPQLNVRLLPSGNSLPQPVILDTSLRFKTDSKLLNNYRDGTGKQPWLICSTGVHPDRVQELENAGAKVIAIASQLTVPAVLAKLHNLGIKSLMVEGGARVIGSFLAHPDVVDTLIITVAPTLVGPLGVGYAAHESTSSKFMQRESQSFGRDTVVVLVPKISDTEG
ncbi:bacterial bifunctional deaminase-reductase [Cylindrobasidium torrendii FP15055 ss-10]|uniref:2,5-diamino-6-ribosylamino-4(3H)-pyrimidinone 5'-phosphate reductase n=1 Tax=Cylindrobasidium torrendii FP15055 ss-10 TaxID=1314674 RepID=A0A0D7BGP4_9AGAR|nr:bacterial bifunctional deaminase-reductase [Cylindrobasidium torrendii FP15055 ss-10]